MARYIALIDRSTAAYGAVFPDLPGCTAMGRTMRDLLNDATEALRDWIEITIENGGKIPQPRSLETLRHDPDVKHSFAGGAVSFAIELCN